MGETTRPRSCDRKLKTAEIKLQKILHKIETLKLDNWYKSQIDVKCARSRISQYFEGRNKYFIISLVIVALLFSVWRIYLEFSNRACILTLPSSAKSLFRPPEDCSMCEGVHEVPRVANITPQEFEDTFAYTTSPVIVVDATEGWKAMKEFNFNFFSNFYRNGKMGKQINDCFYFAYKSGLNSLDEVFNMDEKRANLSGAPWYVGWSTCYDQETTRLRTYYSRPYFLPKTAESDMVDWIFMGGPGQGAHMHVDSVRHMSWQAQVRGNKRWQLAPPPECLYRCRWLTLTVHPGEILVVDTNRWYHRTSVLPGDISITIGAEYD